MMSRFLLCVLLSTIPSLSGAFVIPAGSGTSSSSSSSSVSATSRTSSTVVAWGVPPTRETIVMMPATIEKEKTVRTGSTGPAVLDRTETERPTRSPKKESKTRVGGENWEVRIYNDGMNTREHVARSLVRITGMSEMSAYQTMMQAHQNGIAVVGRWSFEIAELYNEGLRKNGIISDMVPVDEES